MHREWRVDVTGKLKPIGNELFINFRAAVFEDMRRNEEMKNWRLPANYSFSRKSAYQYGWDWGPRLVTCGIWKPVRIEAYNTGRIESFHVRTLKISEKMAKLSFESDIELISWGWFEVLVY